MPKKEKLSDDESQQVNGGWYSEPYNPPYHIYISRFNPTGEVDEQGREFCYNYKHCDGCDDSCENGWCSEWSPRR
jgi:hypothetical protein